MSPELFGTARGPLTPKLFPSGSTVGTNNNGLNAATADAPDDRALTTDPTGVSGAVLELVLTNNTGSDLTALSISYDIRRFQVGVGGDDELPGYWLFYSLDGGITYFNVAKLNPTIRNVPDTVGVTRIGGRFDLDSPLVKGESINLCWVDDNGGAPSPDQIIGLDNVSVTIPGAAPAPPSIGIRFYGSGGPPDSPAM